MGVRSWQQWRAIVTRSNISSICSIPELEILYQLRSSAIMLVSCDLCPRLYKYNLSESVSDARSSWSWLLFC